MNHIYLSHNAGVILLSYFRKAGHELMLVPPGGRTYSAVDAHPDIYYCRMEQSPHPFLFRGDPLEIGRSYPDNIRFNAVALDRYFIHRLKNTSPALLKKAREMGLECINVNQGYTKCNCVVVDGHSLITSDEGIDRTLQGYPDLHVLKIRPGFVRLEGFDYGFLGGASGRVGEEIVFNGDLSAHPDCDAICRFIRSRGLRVKYFPNYPLTDIGSILADF